MQKQEKDIEARFNERMKECSCLPLKFVSPGFNGVPDRIVLVPGGHVVFVELKQEGKKARKLQLHVHKRIRNFGFLVFSDVSTPEDINDVVKACRGLQHVE
jgi:hypothetical protein